MDGQLVQVCLPSHFLPELVFPVENLSPEVAELRALVHRLQAENHEFRQQAGYWKSRHCDNLKCINALERKAEPIPMVFGHCWLSESLLFPTTRLSSAGEKGGLVQPLRRCPASRRPMNWF